MTTKTFATIKTLTLRALCDGVSGAVKRGDVLVVFRNDQTGEINFLNNGKAYAVPDRFLRWVDDPHYFETIRQSA